MRRCGLWHPRLAQLIAGLGHGQLLVVADPGLPVPAGVEIIDLVYTRGEPAFLPVLRTVVGDLVIEHATIATDLADAKLRKEIGDLLAPVPVTGVDHEELKALTGRAAAVVRTGEDTPYANIVLRAGVPF